MPGFSAKTVHFPPWSAGVPPPQASLAALGISAPGESAGFFRENGSLSPRHETSEEVQQSLLGKVPSIQALWKRASAGPGVKWQFYGEKRAVQQIAKIYTSNNQHDTFGRCVGHCNSSY